jgi:dephospho-CoA kinase
MKHPGYTKIKLGITGGIGSGKTSVCRVFNVLGIPVFSADAEAQIIMDSNENIIHGINSLANSNLYVDGTLNRRKLSDLIFNDGNLLKKVNSLVHPVVFEHFIKWEKDQTSPYVIMEAAILFESGASKLVDKTLTVVAPEQERIERVVHRNYLTKKQVLERIRNQMDDDSKIKLSDYVIQNSDYDMIIPAILVIHNDILNHIKTNT